MNENTFKENENISIKNCIFDLKKLELFNEKRCRFLINCLKLTIARDRTINSLYSNERTNIIFEIKRANSLKDLLC